MIPNSALCLAKLPAPLMLNYSLGADRLLVSRVGTGPYHPALFGSPLPRSRMPLTSLFSCLHALPVLYPCQRAKSPLGTQLRLDVPAELAQARPLVPAAASLQ